MEQFRRPLGVLIAGTASPCSASRWSQHRTAATGGQPDRLGAGIALLVALGASAVIVWRLVRKPTA
jgi:hypothetical protein